MVEEEAVFVLSFWVLCLNTRPLHSVVSLGLGPTNPTQPEAPGLACLLLNIFPVWC